MFLIWGSEPANISELISPHLDRTLERMLSKYERRSTTLGKISSLEFLAILFVWDQYEWGRHPAGSTGSHLEPCDNCNPFTQVL